MSTNKVIIVGGGKGGVGKSTVSVALLDMLKTEQRNVVYVETDDSNPDVYKMVNGSVKSEVCNLDNEGGFLKLGGIIEANKDCCIVVNTAARATEQIIEHGYMITETATEVGMEAVMLWPINRQRDCLELLKSFVDKASGYKATHVIVNQYFGSADKFALYNGSKLKGQVETIIFPELNDLVADKITTERIALWENTKKFSIAERSVLSRYRTQATEALKVVL